MPTYFGETTPGGSFDRNASFTPGNYTNYGPGFFTCPGSGNQTLKELSAYVKSNGGTPGTIRLAIYEGGTGVVNLIAQGTAAVTVSSTTAGWVGHLTQVDITPNPTTLTGGSNYTIYVSGDTTDVMMGFNAGTDDRFASANYTATGFPATLNKAIMSGTVRFNVRAGVDSAVVPTDTLMPQIWM